MSNNIKFVRGVIGEDPAEVPIPFARVIEEVVSSEAEVAYVEGSPANAVAARLQTTLTGSNNDLVWTALTKGTGGNGFSVEYVDPETDGAEESIDYNEETGKITVALATDDGDAATAVTAKGTTVTLADAGSAGNVFAVTIRWGIFNVLGVPWPLAGQSLSAEWDATGLVVTVATDAGTASELTLAEGSGSAGELTIATTGDYVGAWANGVVKAKIGLASEALQSLSVAVTDNGVDEILIAIVLESDADGDPVAISDDALADAINTALDASDWADMLLATSSTAGDFDSGHAVATCAGGAGPSSDIVANAAATVEAAMETVDEIASATGGSGNYAEAPTVQFTDGGANYAITSTGDTIKATVAGDETVAGLVACEDAIGNDGSGVVTAMNDGEVGEGVALEGGVDGTVATVPTFYYDVTNETLCFAPSNTATEAKWVPIYLKAVWTTVSTDYLLSDADHGKMLLVTAAVTITRPAGLRSGFTCRVLATHASGCTIAAGAAVTINTARGGLTVAQHEQVSLTNYDTNTDNLA